MKRHPDMLPQTHELVARLAIERSKTKSFETSKFALPTLSAFIIYAYLKDR
jgi:hypothetical protein